MNDYKTVTAEIAAGTPADVLCATCPWTRPCIEPAGLTKAEYDRDIAEAEQQDKERAEQQRADGKDPGLPFGSVLAMIAKAPLLDAAKVCPVFGSRFQADRSLADTIRRIMKGES